VIEVYTLKSAEQIFGAGQNHWARDFIFVFGDDYIEGIEAFLATYHGLTGDSESICWKTKAFTNNSFASLANRNRG
jgi:hypothetical protein